MLRLALSVLACGASAGCGFAAVGLALYGAGGPGPYSAALLLFGGIGALCGLVCGVLHVAVAGVPVPPRRALPTPELARQVRAVLARAAAERQARPGSAADRRPPAAAPDLPPLTSGAFGR